MVDLHSHILPCFDDGSKSYEETEKLIKIEIDAGVNKVALTPHFLFGRCPLEKFIKKRQDTVESVKKQLASSNLNVDIILGAEVKLSREMLDEKNIKELCYSNTDYMLVELPNSYYRDWIPYVLYNLKINGITPVIAHVERYNYFYKHTDLLYDIVSTGSIAQINADSVIHPNWFIKNLIKHNFVHIIATDSHSVDSRPPRLKQAMKIIEKKYGNEYADYFKNNSDIIANNSEPELYEPVKFKKRFFNL